MLHEVLNESPPKHPLISVIDLSKFKNATDFSHFNGVKTSTSFYGITLKHLKAGCLYYGRKKIDFQEGSLFFTLPGHVGELENLMFDESNYSWGLFFHPDLLYGTTLSSKIKDYTFFSYSTDEALHLSEDEKKTWRLLSVQFKSNSATPLISTQKVSWYQVSKCY